MNLINRWTILTDEPCSSVTLVHQFQVHQFLQIHQFQVHQIWSNVWVHQIDHSFSGSSNVRFINFFRFINLIKCLLTWISIFVQCLLTWISFDTPHDLNQCYIKQPDHCNTYIWEINKSHNIFIYITVV